MTLTLRSAADAAARATKSKNEERKTCMTILLFTRKGLRWTVYAGLLALRVRMLIVTVHNIRLCTAGLPGIHPSGRLRSSRLQLRGSAGIAPASLSLPEGKDAQTEGHFKEREKVVRGIYRGGAVKVNCRADGSGAVCQTAPLPLIAAKLPTDEPIQAL